MSDKPLIESIDTNQEHHERSIGSLRGEVWLTVQSYQAQSLVHGRRSGDGKPAIIGLVGFADRLKTLWQAARQNDPYADWWLIKTEESIAACREQLNHLFEQFNQLLKSHYNFEVAIAESSKPQRIALQFANPYAFRAAQMLAEFDRSLRPTPFRDPLTSLPSTGVSDVPVDNGDSLNESNADNERRD